MTTDIHGCCDLCSLITDNRLLFSSAAAWRLQLLNHKVAVEDFLTLALQADAAPDEGFAGLLAALFGVTQVGDEVDGVAVVDDLHGIGTMDDGLKGVPLAVGIAIGCFSRVVGEDGAFAEGGCIVGLAALGLGQVGFTSLIDKAGGEWAEFARQPDAAGCFGEHVDLHRAGPVVLHTLGVEIDMAHQPCVHRAALGTPAVVHLDVVVAVRCLGGNQAIGAFFDVDLPRLGDKDVLLVHIINVALTTEVDAEVIQGATVEWLPVRGRGWRLCPIWRFFRTPVERFLLAGSATATALRIDKERAKRMFFVIRLLRGQVGEIFLRKAEGGKRE